MVYFYKLLATLFTLSILGTIAFLLVSSGTVKADIFPFTVLTGIASLLTVAINEVINSLVGLSLENKAMKDREAMRVLLKEELQPLKDDVSYIKGKVDKVIDNQNHLILELREKGIIEKTSLIPTAV